MRIGESQGPAITRPPAPARILTVTETVTRLNPAHCPLKTPSKRPRGVGTGSSQAAFHAAHPALLPPDCFADCNCVQNHFTWSMLWIRFAPLCLRAFWRIHVRHYCAVDGTEGFLLVMTPILDNRKENVSISFKSASFFTKRSHVCVNSFFDLF